MSDMPVPVPKDDRPRYTFTIPEEERVYLTDPHTFTVTHTRVSDEIEAGKIARALGGAEDLVLLEKVRRSVVEVDGKPVDWGAPGGAEWIERCSPQAREFVLLGYQAAHSLKKGSVSRAAFLASMQVRTP